MAFPLLSGGYVFPSGIVHNQMAAPLRSPGHRPFGCIQQVNKKEGRFDDEDGKLAGNLVALMALDIEDKGYQIPRLPERKPMIVLPE